MRRILAVVRKTRKRSLLGDGGVNMVGLPWGYWREDVTIKKGWRRREGGRGGMEGGRVRGHHLSKPRVPAPAAVNLQRTAAQCSAVQYSAVQCTAVQCCELAVYDRAV